MCCRAEGQACAAATVPAHQSIVDEVVLQHASMQLVVLQHMTLQHVVLPMAMLCPSWCNTSPMLNCLYVQQNLVSTSKPDNQSEDWCQQHDLLEWRAKVHVWLYEWHQCRRSSCTTLTDNRKQCTAASMVSIVSVQWLRHCTAHRSITRSSVFCRRMKCH